ncbi:hypothetical protein [Corynebacterium pacaense]|uniref:hypothetical protein n=1 Tax=Corynebacterium pacaense TaxID=1816684 RepID=UPI0009BB651C|nr:hypothetical protein [Corynebacterium pacaense]
MRPLFLSPSLYATLSAVLLTGLIARFFYAWVCSTMWGPMQEMNASVSNAVFFPVFFLTPLVLIIAAVAHSCSRRPDADRHDQRPDE